MVSPGAREQCEVQPIDGVGPAPSEARGRVRAWRVRLLATDEMLTGFAPELDYLAPTVLASGNGREIRLTVSARGAQEAGAYAVHRVSRAAGRTIALQLLDVEPE